MPSARPLRGSSPRLAVESLEDRSVPAGGLFISEVHFDPLFGSVDQDEYIEIRGDPNAVIPAKTYFAVVDGDGPNQSGTVHSVFDLSGLTLGSDGYLVIVEAGSNYPIKPTATVLKGTTVGFGGLPGNRFSDDSGLSDRFEFIIGSTTFMLFHSNIPPTPGTDYDLNDDGKLDGPAGIWNVLDSVGEVGTFVGANAAHHGYGKINFAVGGLGNFPVGSTVVSTVDFGYVGRVGESTGYDPSDWVAGQTVEFPLGSNNFNFRFESSIFGHPTIGYLAGRSLDHLGASNFVASLTGTAFSDDNTSGVRDAGEAGIPGVRINLEEASGNQFGSQFFRQVEPDDFANGTELTNAIPGVTFTEADNQNVQRGRGIVANLNAANATTGSLVFGRGVFWFDDTSRLRMDFYHPVQSISIDYKQTTLATGFGRLSVFDANGNLLETFLSQPVPNGSFATLAINRPTADIAFAVAYSDPSGTPFGYLDNLRFSGPAPFAITRADGSYILNVQDGTFNVIPTRVPGSFLTSPRPGGFYSVDVTGGVGARNLDFGYGKGRGDFTQVLAAAGDAGQVAVYQPAVAGGYDERNAFNLAVPPILSTFGSTVRTATGDVNGDGVEDFVLVTGPGIPIQIAVIDGNDAQSLLVAPISPFVGSEDFTGGGFVSTGDINGDGIAEFAVTPDQGGGPRVTIFSLSGGIPTVRANFLAIADSNFRGGARAAIGDINGDGLGDLLVAAGVGGGPRVAVYDGNTLYTARNRLVGDFFVFDPVLRDGVYAGIGDMNGDGLGDIIVGAGMGGSPRVLVIDAAALLSGGALTAVNQPYSSFFADDGFDSNRSGVRIAIKDVDNDGLADVITGSTEGQIARVRVFTAQTINAGFPTSIQDLFPFNAFPMENGVYVG